MRWPEAGERLFPSPHRAEPENLRRDITDELADHLALATEDEVVKHGRSHEAAWKRAIERFGNPDAVARRLWWDAMRERVMRDWIQTGIAAVSAIVLVLVAVLVVSSLKQMQVTQVQLIETLQRMNQPAAPTAQGETLNIEVRRGTAEGPPAVGIRVTLSGTLNGEKAAEVKLDTDAEGRVRFSPVPQGAYSLKIYDPQSGMNLYTTHSLFAGVGSSLQIIAPDYALAPTPVGLESPLPFPNDRVLARVNVTVSDTINELPWRYKETLYVGNAGTSVVAKVDTPTSSPSRQPQPTGFFALDLAGPPSPTILLPPRKITLSIQQLVFRRTDGNVADITGHPRKDQSHENKMLEGGKPITIELPEDDVNYAETWVKLYTFGTRWLDQSVNQMQMGGLPVDKYLVAAVPITDALTASVSETDSNATLTVLPSQEINGYTLVGSENNAAFFKFPDPSSLSKAHSPNGRFLFHLCGPESGTVLPWTGRDWKTDLSATFEVKLGQPIPAENAFEQQWIDVTDVVAASADTAPGGILVRDIVARDNSFKVKGIYVAAPKDAEKSLYPCLFVVSDTPPADL